MKKLYCCGTYHNVPRNLHFHTGWVNVDDPVAEFLATDAPGLFVEVEPQPEVEPESKAPEAPPKDKMIRSPRRSKDAAG